MDSCIAFLGGPLAVRRFAFCPKEAEKIGFSIGSLFGPEDFLVLLGFGQA